jgi:SAM-dependent methyltransferase
MPPFGHGSPLRASGPPAGFAADPAYALARSRDEYERLSRQAAFLKGTTERLFRAAGLKPCMRILDVGSGAGDVVFLAAEFVGPEGEVVGVDLDGAALAVARERAQSLGLNNVTFIEDDAHGRARRGLRRRRWSARSHVLGRSG